MQQVEAHVVNGTSIIDGQATGQVLYSSEPISMMGGVDPLTGVVIDTHHPLLGECIAGRILVIPGGRGSCAGSGALFEMLLGGTAPAALIFCQEETILTIGAVIADEFFEQSLPIVRIEEAQHARFAKVGHASVVDGKITSDAPVARATEPDATADRAPRTPPAVRLTETDRRMLDGEFGPAVTAAMRVTLKAAELEGAEELIDVTMAHIDGNFYQGPASLAFAERLCDLGAEVRIPATMNSLMVDRLRWRDHGVATELGEPSEQLADAYLRMGVSESYTCAPYWLDDAPKFGEQIVWAESNAVVFANSVLGARTLKYPDYLDILIAITGRAPAAGTHLPLARRATAQFHLAGLDEFDESLFPMLGYLIGQMSPYELPVVTGLETAEVTRDDLRAFGAALATTSAAPMFHIVGVTPEAPSLAAALGNCDAIVPVHTIQAADLRRTHAELNTAETTDVGVVAFGNPHFSLTELEKLAKLCDGMEIAEGVQLMITCGREIHRRGADRGFVERIERAGGVFITDTCWCLIREPVVPAGSAPVMTNSAKYAHYGPAQVGQGMHFGSFADCLEAARTGVAPQVLPSWLT